MRGGHGTGEGSADAALRMRGFSRAGGDVESGISVDEFDDGNSPSSPIEAAKRANATSTAHDASSANHTTAKLWGIPLKMQGKDLALFLGTGALVSYLGFTSTQESVFHNAGPGGFQHGGAVTLVTTLVYGILAYLERVRAGEHTVRKGSWRHYFVLALLTSSGMYATNAALTYLNYTTRIVAKSSKVIPTMVIGSVVQNRKYSINEYAAAFMLVIGIVCFTLGDQETNLSFNPRGVFLILGALFADSFAANFEEKKFFDIPSPVSHAEVVFHANLVGAVFTIGAMAVTGELSTAMTSLGVLTGGNAGYVGTTVGDTTTRYGAEEVLGGDDERINSIESIDDSFATALPAVLISATFGYISVSFILLLIRHFGASNAEVLKSSRKLISIGLSLLLYPKPFSWKLVLGTVSTICGLTYLYHLKRRKLLAAAPGAGWEATK